jgi:hypothetical protein
MSVSILSGNISKLSTTFVLFISPGSAPNSASRVLLDRHQSKSESVFKVLPLVHCVPTNITSSLFIRSERMSNDCKVEEVNYECGIGSFLRLFLDWTQKFKILRLLKSDKPRISAVRPTSKLHNS